MLKHFKQTVLGLGALSAVSASSTGHAAADSSSFFDSAWSQMGFVLGYGNEQAYVKYACFGEDPGTGNSCDGPPREGMVRTFVGIVEGFLASLDSTVCADIPVTGTKTLSTTAMNSTLTGTATFAAAQQSIPAAWTGGGTAFDRRIEISFSLMSQPTKAVIELSCAQADTAFIAMNMVTATSGFNRHINVWVGAKDSKRTGDVYVIEQTSANNVRAAYVYHVDIDETAKQYSIWGAAATHFSGTSVKAMDTANIKGNYSSHQMSLRMRRFTGDQTGSGETAYMDPTSFSSLTGFDQADLGTITTFSNMLTSQSSPTAGVVSESQGCMDFDTPTTAPTSNAACTDLDFPGTAPTPVIDASGEFSAAWVLGTAKTKLVDIPAL
ncbi:hypothetical protein [Oligoflexus tunisiensis]|uniref:hypothetical protein n=1 Tax=Oligoflexus tunisiensis TaxID=708132 RepID=UPI00114D3326|nr:hypothetical protein [Oligoflexus tunisiensis]